MKLDENVPDSVGEILVEKGHDVALAREEDLGGETDDELLAAASTEGRALVTLDSTSETWSGTRREQPPGSSFCVRRGRPFPRFSR